MANKVASITGKVFVFYSQDEDGLNVGMALSGEGFKREDFFIHDNNGDYSISGSSEVVVAFKQKDLDKVGINRQQAQEALSELYNLEDEDEDLSESSDRKKVINVDGIEIKFNMKEVDWDSKYNQFG